MAMAEEIQTAPVRAERMSDLDALIWSIERDPRLRSTFVAVAFLDGAVDRVALRHRLDRASRRAPSLRRRAVPDPVPIAPPRWEVDSGFCPAAHLRVTTLGGQAGRADVFALAAAVAGEPFDHDRPLWEVTLVDGIEGETPTALILKCHHAVADGVGGFELAMEIFDVEGARTADDLPAVPAPTPTPLNPFEDAIRHEARVALDSMRRALDTVLIAGLDPVGAARHAGHLVGAVDRLVRAPMTARRSNRPTRSDAAGTGFHHLVVPLDGLRTAGRSVGGTINDAFVAGVALGTARHLDRAGRHDHPLEIAVPINVRPRGDAGGTGGNRWAPGRVTIPIDDTDEDPATILHRVRAATRSLRAEPVHELLDPAAGVLRHVPTAISAPLMASIMGGVDVTASNVPGSPVPLTLMGRRVCDLVPFGPLVGTPINVTLLSVGDAAHIGIAHDTSTITDVDLIHDDYRDAFERLLR